MKVMHKCIQRSFVIGITAVALFSSSVLGQVQFIPSNNNDLKEIISKTERFRAVARTCPGAMCPDVDCEKAQKAFRDLSDAMEYLRYTKYWYQRAALDHRRHFESLAEQGKITTENMRKVQEAIAIQQYLTSFGSALADIAGAAESMKDLLANPAALDELSYAELVEKIDGFYEMIKGVESGIRTVQEGSNPDAQRARKITSLGSDELDDHKSTLSNLKKLADNAKKSQKSWRKFLNSRSTRTALGGIAARYLKEYSLAELEKRKRRLEELNKDLTASDLAQAESFKSYMKIVARRNLVEDAYRGIESLIVIDAKAKTGSLTLCMLKGRNKCKGLDLNYVSKVRFPDDVRVDDFHFFKEISHQPRSWSKALVYFNAQIPKVSKLLDPPGQFVTVNPDEIRETGPVAAVERMESVFSSGKFKWKYIENFNDSLLNSKGLAGDGKPSSTFGQDLVDSRSGDAWWGGGSLTLTFSKEKLGQYPNRIGLVWTDGGPGAAVTIEVWCDCGTSRVYGPYSGFADGNFKGGKAEDRFFGFSSTNGITKIKISNSEGGIEIDDVFYGLAP